jgi:hypothetical protein
VFIWIAEIFKIKNGAAFGCEFNRKNLACLALLELE